MQHFFSSRTNSSRRLPGAVVGLLVVAAFIVYATAPAVALAGSILASIVIALTVKPATTTQASDVKKDKLDRVVSPRG